MQASIPRRLAAWGILVIAGLLLLGLSACRRDYPEINLQPPEEEDATTAPTPHYDPQDQPFYDSEGEEPYLRLAIAPLVSSPQTEENYRQLLSYLPEIIDRPVEVVLRSSQGEINQLLEQNLVDVALIGPGCYVELKEAGYPPEILAVPEIQGETGYRSYIITSADNQGTELADLENRDFVFTDPLSFSGNHYVMRQLSQRGKDPEEFFSNYFYSHNPDNSIIAVAEGWIEGGAVNNLVYYYMLDYQPELEAKLQVLESSSPAGYLTLVARQDLKPELKDQLRETFLSLHQEPRGEEVLGEMRIDRFLPPEEVPYELDEEKLLREERRQR